jgi:Kyanoviridae DNA helicase
MTEEDVLRVEAVDEVWIRLHSVPHVLVELESAFTFEVPGYKFMPTYRLGVWDGKIKLFNAHRGVLYKGLLFQVVKWCRARRVRVDIGEGVWTSSYSGDHDLVAQAEEWTPDDKEPRQYQLDSFEHCVREGRSLVLSSTSSGKTLMIWRLAKWYGEPGRPVLILTTRKNLVAQAADDFAEYSGGRMRVHQVREKTDRITWAADTEVVVSTWQSALRETDHEWFSRFSAIVADEAHSWDSSAFLKIAERWSGVKYRFGFTGSLDGSKVNKMTLTGLFGEPRVASRNADRIAAGEVSRPNIRMVRVDYTDQERRFVSKFAKNPITGKWEPMSYKQEVEFVIGHEGRRRLVLNLLAKLKGNTIVLFNRNSAYGEPMRDAMIAEFGVDRVHFVNGDVSTEDRRAAQAALETGDGIKVLASLGTFSEGMSVNNVHNVLFVFPMKSQVRVLQSIGRGLRLADGKTSCDFYDLVDDLRLGRRSNVLWRHALSRCEVYDAEEFDYTWTEGLEHA